MAVERGSGSIPVNAPAPGVTASGLSTFGYIPPPSFETVVRQTPEQEALEFLNDPRQLQLASAARSNGSEYNELSSDFRNMDFLSLVDKYGENAARQRINLINSDQAFSETLNTERGPIDLYADTVGDLGIGLTGIVGGLASATLGAAGKLDERFNPDNTGFIELGVKTAQITNTVTEAIMNSQSEELRNRRESRNLEDSFSINESQDRYEEEVDNGSNSTLANIRRIGRNVATTAETMWEDPAMAASLTGQGIGSIFVSAKLANIASNLVGRNSTAAALANAINPTVGNAARLAATKTAERGAVLLSIGLSEGSGLYPRAVQQVMSMSENELANNSESYVQMRNDGLNHEEAQTRIANDAALLAVAVQIPVAALISGATSVRQFEMAPMQASSFSGGLRELGKQTIEESLQGASGDISGSFGIQQVADQRQALTERVGESFVEGAVGGLGMSAVLQTPSMLGAGARGAVNAAGNAVRGTVRAGQNYVAGQIQRRDDANPVGRNATQQAVTRVEENIATVAQAVPQSQVSNIVSMDQDEVAGMTDSIRAIAIPAEGETSDTIPNSRLGVLDRLVQAVESKTLDEPTSREATLQAYMEMQKLQGFALNDVPQEIQSLPQDDPIYVAYEQAQADLGAIVENPSYQSVMEKAQSMEQDNTPDIPIPELTPTFVNETIAIAMSNPAGVNPRFIDAILNQEGTEENTPIDVLDLSERIKPMVLTESVRSRLTAAKVISEEMLRSIEIKDRIEAERVESINSSSNTETPVSSRKTKDIVRQEIHIDGKAIGKGSKSGGQDRVLPSLNDFYRNIISSVENNNQTVLDRQGLPVDSQGSIESLGNFAEHMINKIGAFNKSAQGGKGEQIPFRTLTTNGWTNSDQSNASRVYANTKSPNSIALSKEALVDAQTAVSLYNNMLKLFPHLNGSPLKMPVLVPELANAGVVKITQAEVNRLANESEAPPATDGDPNIVVPKKPVVEPTKPEIVDPEDQGETTSEEKPVLLRTDEKTAQKFWDSASVEVKRAIVIQNFAWSNEEKKTKLINMDFIKLNAIDSRAIDILTRALVGNNGKIRKEFMDQAETKPKPKSVGSVTVIKNEDGFPEGAEGKNFSMTNRGPNTIINFKEAVFGVKTIHILDHDIILNFEDSRSAQLRPQDQEKGIFVQLQGKKNSQGNYTLIQFSYLSDVAFDQNKPTAKSSHKSGDYSMESLTESRLDPAIANGALQMHADIKDGEHPSITAVDFLINVFDVNLVEFKINKSEFVLKGFGDNPPKREIDLLDKLKQRLTSEEEVVEQIKPKSQEEIDDDSFREIQDIYDLDYLNDVEKETLTVYSEDYDIVPTREQHKILVQILTDYLQAFGMAFGKEVIGGLVVKNGGYARWSKKLVSFDAQILANPETERSRHIILHEVGHILDNKLGEGDQRRSVTDGRLSPEKEGDLYKEVMQLVEKDEKWKRFFKYALSGGANNQTAESLDNEKSQELFAELFSIYYNNPTLMKEELPNAREYIEAIVEEAIEGDTRSNDGETTPTESIPSEDGIDTDTQEVTEPEITAEKTETIADKELLSENTDVGSLLDIMGISYTEEAMGNDLSVEQIVSAQERIMEIQKEVSENPESFDGFKSELQKLVSWFKSDQKNNSERETRAKKSAEKYGNGNLNANYLAQVAEELGELATEVSRVNPEQKLDETEMEIRKRRLKVIRFGPDTVIKGKEGDLYVGMTNQEALDSLLIEDKSTIEEISLPDNLAKDSKGIARFTRAYTIQKGKSLLSSLVQPLLYMVETFGSASLMNERSKNELTFNMTSSQREAFQNMLREDIPAIMDKMNDRLKSVIFDKKSNKTIIDLIQGDQTILDATSLLKGKVGTLVDVENGQYDQRLLEQATMAAIHWVMDNKNSSDRVFSIEKAAKIFKVEEGNVTEDMLNALRFGVDQTTAKEQLSSLIEQFWGVSRKNDVTMSDTRGISESLAAELLTVLEGDYIKTGEFTVNKSVFNENSNQIDIIRVKMLSISTNVQSFKERIDSFGQLAYALGNMILEGYEREGGIIGKSPKSVVLSQRRNPFSAISRKETIAIETAQKIAFYRNSDFIDMMNALGQKAYSEILGFIEINEATTNKQDKKAIEGRNISIRMGWEGVMSHDIALKSYAEANDVNANDVPTFYNWYITKVGRLHMNGFGPQSDKTSREALIATVSNLNMNEEESQGFFWMTVAQSLGMKVEKSNRYVNMEKAKELVQSNYPQSIKALEGWLEDTSKPLGSTEIQTIQSELKDGGEQTQKAMHALLAVAKLNRAMKQNDPEAMTNFNHMLSLEADGKTDGPINAMMHFISGGFTQTQLDLLAKGGFFLNKKSYAFSDHVNDGDADDLYMVAAKKMQYYINGLRDNFINDKSPSLKYMNALLRLSNHFGEIEFNEKTGELVIGRNTMKNPLTVTIYGSGIDGITSKVSNALISSIYENFTREAQQANDIISYKEMNADMNLLFGNRTFKNVSTGKWDTHSKQQPLSNSSDPVNFEFTKEARANFHVNLKELFVKPMSSAINDMMGSTVETMAVFQKATQIQSIVMIDFFNSRVKQKTEELVQSGELKKGEFLSQKDYNQIFREMSRFGAIVENDDQTINMGSASKGGGDRPLSSNLEGSFRGDANLSGPSEAGVKSAPYITINRGDALMIINIYGESITIPKSVPVFDGVEVAADEMDTASELINEAVAKSWETNPAKDVSDSFNAFLRESPLDGISPEGLMQLRKGLRLDKDVNIEDVMQGVRNNLERIANEIQARKDTIREIAYSVDHMAGASAPFTHEGITLTGSKEDVIRQINAMYEANLEKNESQKPKKALEKENRKFRNLVKKYGSKNETDDVTTMYWEEFSNMMENNTELSPDQKRVYEVVKNAVDKDFTFIFGSQEEVTKYRDRVSPERSNGKLIPEGQIDTLNKVIYVTNISGETALHELVHAATIGKVFNYYVDPSVLTPKEQDAVRRMEVLMNEFRVRDYGYDTPQVQEATRLAKKAIEQNLGLSNDLGMASALNEFMAWSMTNQNIVDVSKVTRIKNPLALIAQKVLKLMGRLVGGDIFSNMLFNTEVLLSRPQELNEVIPAVVQLNQQSGSQAPSRMSMLMDRFENKVAYWVRNREMSDPLATARYDHVLAESQAKQTVNLFDANGFRMDMEQAAAFQSIQAAMATTMKVDGLVQARMQKLYTYTMKQLSVESFMVDPNSTNPNDRWLAEHQYNVLSGAYGTVTDVQGNSNLLSSFVALSQTNEDFRNILKKISIPKAFSINKSSVDDFLTSSANSMLDSLAITVTKEGRNNQTIESAMDNLTHALSSIERDAQSYIEKSYNNLMNIADERIQGVLTRVGDEIFDSSDVQIRNASSNLKKKIFQSTKLLSGILSEDKGEIIANAGIAFMNEMGDTLVVVREFMAEIIGITNENKGVLMQVNLVKKAVSSVRQDYRETLPRIFYSKFSRDLTNQEKSMLHLSMGKTDIGALGQSLTVQEISELFKANINVINAVIAAEKELSDMNKANAPDYMRKAKQLANYMVNGVAGESLLRNATAISRLLNESNGPVVADEDTVKLIDKLTTLYAIQNLDRDTKDKMSDLANAESDGLEFMTHYLYALRTKEEEKISNFGNEVPLLNGHKGYIPAEVQDGVQLVLKNDTENANLVKMGYTRVGDYKGPGFRVGPVKMGYYYSAVSGRATYSQGAMQTVQTAINGVDPRNGRTLTGDTAGFLSGTSVSLINKKAKSQTKNNATETLMPVFGEANNVVAFERSMDPDIMRTLNRNTDMGEAMGMWRGRQAEEEISKQYNEVLVDRIKEMWETAKNESRTKEYVDISESDDPIHMENWMMVPREMKDYIETVFGDEGFMVRREVVNNALGYRTPSIGDAWTGNTRMSEDTRKVITELASIIPDDKGYKYALLGERGIQTVVSTAKDLIIVRSIVVPIANIISNQLQLMVRGVPPRNMLNNQRQFLIEINTYLYHEQRRVELDAEIQANQNNPQAKRKAETELKSMSDFEQKMGIWPLIKAGEFSTISEGMTDIDEALKNQKFADWVEAQANKLPHEIRTLGKYAIMARDTALYQGMYRAVQYGDFLAKATYYDHLVNEKNMSHDEALLLVTEEFVNYNLLPGRTRSYLESMGLLWFWNFKVRSMKTALRMARQNPARVLLLGVSGPVIPDGMNVGSPVTDNLLSVWEDGRLSYSVGPGMALNAPSLNPWTNLMF